MPNIYHIALIYSGHKKWRIVTPFAQLNKFANSGTDTPNDDDIFTDVDIITSGKFVRHPIKKGSFQIQRTQSNTYGDKLTINYIDTHQGFLRSQSTGSGNGKEITLDNWMIRADSDVSTLAGVLDDWLLNQHFIVEFETFYNAIGYEIGDVINIRHADLNDDMLSATVNTQKWMIYEINKNWRPNTIKIKAVELK
jgi:hypothetical protein